MREQSHGRVLLGLARSAIAEKLGIDTPETRNEPWLQQPGATFVTLTRHAQLRGCIGSLQAHRTLREDVSANAIAAAFHDPRFPPLSRDEFESTQVEVSVLSAQVPLVFTSEHDLLAQLKPGQDGLVLEYGTLRSTFLPQVWEQLPEPETFLAHLKVKAGLPDHFWDDRIRLSRYTVTKWKEADFAAQSS